MSDSADISHEPLQSIIDQHVQRRVAEAAKWGYGHIPLEKLLIRDEIEMGMIQQYRHMVSARVEKERAKFKEKKGAIKKQSAAVVCKKIL